MSIKINVDVGLGCVELLDPIRVHGQAEGEVFQQYKDGVAKRDFLISTGTNDNPIDVWWDRDSCKYRLSSSSKKDLRDFVPEIKYRHLPHAKVTITLEC